MKFHIRLAMIASLFTGIAILNAAPQKIRVTDPAMAKDIQARGGKIIADYGSFQLMDVGQATLSKAETAAVQDDTATSIIRLNATKLDTTLSAIKALRKDRGSFDGSSLHMVQFVGPIKSEWYTGLQATGVRILDFVPDNAYLVYGNAQQLSALQTWASGNAAVQWEGAYAPEYKVHPVARASYTSPSGKKGIAPDGYTFQLVNDPKANLVTVALIKAWSSGGSILESSFGPYRNITVAMDPERLDRIAAHADVVSILPYNRRHKLDERQDQIIAGNLVGTTSTNIPNVPSGTGYLTWLASKGFTQAMFTNSIANSGFVVDVADGGIDNGTTTPTHFALYTSGNPSLASRVVYNIIGAGGSGSTSKAGCDGHGNINAHIIGGYDNMTALKVHTDSAGYHYGLGVCPFVKVGSTVVFDPSGNFIMTSPSNGMQAAYTNGARISNNSWGGGYGGVYDSDCQIYDALTRDSAASLAGNQEMVYVFAAGNTGPGVASVSSPGTAKNVIVVGSAENVHSFSYANGGNSPIGLDGCGTSDEEADNADDVSSSSSWGPCIDGRFKPDIMAPGNHITGGVVQSSATTNGTGSANACFDASGVCGLWGGGTNAVGTTNFFPLGQKFFTTSTGTSHAAPAVSGACALLRQFFINQGRTNPSAALMKGFLMNAGRYMGFGNLYQDTLPSPAQGMGEVNLGTCFDGVSRIIRDQVDVFTNTGAIRYIPGSVSDPSKPVRITLAWTDAPGSTTGGAYKNDLDLIVSIGGMTYYGNHMVRDLSVPGSVADKINNVESVYLPAGTTGNFTITVLAANIVAGAVTNNPSLNQDFALIAYNTTSNAAPAPVISGFSIVSESCTPTNNFIDAGETVTINVSMTNSSPSATTNVTLALLSTNGVTNLGATQTYGALTNNGQVVTKQFTFTASPSLPCGGVVTNVFQLVDGSTTYGYPYRISRIGNIVTNIYNYTSTVSIVKIPGVGTGGTNTPAQVYPIPCTISGFTGTVAKVTVTVRGFLHTYGSDVDMLLVGPGATNKTMIMSDSGGPAESRRVNITFDDDADQLLPIFGGLEPDGTYVPVNYNETTNDVYYNMNYDDTDGFTAPAPSIPIGTNSMYSDWLTNFIGANPNGTWSLYIRDDYPGDSGSLTNGYVIHLYTITTNCATCAVASADLAVSQIALPGSTYSNNNVNFTLTVTNTGSGSASAVVVSNTLPAGLSLVSASPSPASTNGSTYGFSLGTLANGTSSNVTITARTSAAGTFTNSATVSSGTSDPNSANNTAKTSITVTAVPPSFGDIVNNGANVTLSWSALANVNYRIQYKTNLQQAAWLDLTGNITTSGSSLSTNLPVGGTQRFYRISAVP